MLADLRKVHRLCPPGPPTKLTLFQIALGTDSPMCLRHPTSCFLSSMRIVVPHLLYFAQSKDKMEQNFSKYCNLEGVL